MIDDFDSDDEQTYEETLFLRATEQVQRTHAQLSQNELLEFYALYKQATVGVNKTDCPSFFNVKDRAKWKAWKNLADMSAVQAKSMYVSKLQELQPSWQPDEKSHGSMGWVVHSVETPPDCSHKPDEQKTAFDFVKEHNVQRLQQCNLNNEQLVQLDENGMSLIHWAADRNAVNCLQYLLQLGANVNLCDAEQQTALHYAASCGHLACVNLLLSYNADRAAKDEDGNTAMDVAENAEIRASLSL